MLGTWTTTTKNAKRGKLQSVPPHFFSFFARCRWCPVRFRDASFCCVCASVGDGEDRLDPRQPVSLKTFRDGGMLVYGVVSTPSVRGRQPLLPSPPVHLDAWALRRRIVVELFRRSKSLRQSRLPPLPPTDLQPVQSRAGRERRIAKEYSLHHAGGRPSGLCALHAAFH